MESWLSLLPHRHSGRIAAHHHTSYPALIMLMLAVGLALLGVGSAASASDVVQSGSVNVQGLVEGQPPIVAPQIVSPAPGSHVSLQAVTIGGNCAAGLVVVVARGGIDAGSALCQSDGTFTVSIQLMPGRNDLTARQYNGLNQSSPVSAAVALYYDAPPISPVYPVGPQPVKPIQPPVVPPLYIQTAQNYLGVFAGTPVDLSVSLMGGAPPYALTIDWGDGSSDLISQPASGMHQYHHIYLSPNSYAILMKASDSTGLSAVYQSLILVAGAVQPSNLHREIGSQLLIAWPLFAIGFALIVSFWLGEKFDAQRWQHRT